MKTLAEINAELFGEAPTRASTAPSLEEINRGILESRDRSNFASGLSAGGYQTQGLLYGAAGLVGDLTGWEGASQWGREGYQRNMAEAARNPPPVGFTDIGSLGEAGQWAAYTLGNLVPTMATLAVSGGVGGLAGRYAVRKGVETAFKQGALAAGRSGVARQGMLEAGREAAARLAGRGVTWGAGAGAGMGSTAIEGGSIHQEIIDETGEAHPGKALVGGMVAGAFDAVPLVALLNRFGVGKAAIKEIGQSLAEKGIIKRIGVGAGAQAVYEGSTEALQEIIHNGALAWADQNRELFEPGDWKQIVEAGAAGTLMGLTMGGIGGAFGGRATIPAEEDSPDEGLDNMAEYRRKLESGEGIEVRELPVADITLEARKASPDRNEREFAHAADDLRGSVRRDMARLSGQDFPMAEEIPSTEGIEVEELPGTEGIEVREVDPATVFPPGPEGIEVEELDARQYFEPPAVEGLDVNELRSPIDLQAHEAATSPLNDRPEPTDGQIEAGNYPKGHIRIPGQNIEVSIENPAGSVRRSKPGAEQPWQSTLTYHYGYVLNTMGEDGEPIDAFIGPDIEKLDAPVFVVKQKDRQGLFDEEKLLFGFPDAESAQAAYLSNYPANWLEIQGGELDMRKMSYPVYRAWAGKVTRQRRETPEQASKRSEAALVRSRGGGLDQSLDTIETAVAKLGGLNRDSLGGDLDEGLIFMETARGKRPVLGRGTLLPVVRKQGGMSPDAMAEALSQYGYPVLNAEGGYDPHVMLEALNRAARGEEVYSIYRSTENLEREYEEYRAQQEEDWQDEQKAAWDQISREMADEGGGEALSRTQVKIRELAPIALQYNEDATERVLESDAPDADVARQLQEIIDEHENVSQSSAEVRAPAQVESAEPGKPRQKTGIARRTGQPEAEAFELTPQRAPKPKTTAKAEKQAELLPPPTTGEQVRQARADRDLKQKTAPPMDEGEGDVFSDKLKQKDVEDVAKAKSSKQEKAEAPKSREPAPKPAEKAETGKSEEKIEDFGEVLHGARKHYAQKLKDAESFDIASEPLSKTWPEPNYQQLLDEGNDPWTVAFIHAARDEVPRKPVKSWKLKQWVGQVEALRNSANNFLTHPDTAKKAQESLVDHPVLGKFRHKVDLYLAAGHEHSLKGVRFDKSRYTMYNREKYDPPKEIWEVTKAAKATAFSNMPRVIARGDTKEQAIEDFKKVVDTGTLEQSRSKTVRFDIYSKRSEKGKVYIGKKIGRDYLDLESFESAGEAREYLKNNREALEKKLAKFKEIPAHRKESNSPRVGIDHRNGADVTPEQFTDTFGFRGVQFGNYVEGPRRQEDLNETYDALMDLAGILNIPAKALSLNGELGLAFGARGKGGKRAAAAHFEPDSIVINLTKRRGAGSLAHEWWHSLDNYFARKRGEPGYLTENVESRREPTGVRPEMVEAFRNVTQTINRTKLRQRSKKLDRTRTTPYWQTGREMSARSFESYVIERLRDQEGANDYLANIVSEDYWRAAEALGLDKKGTYPYPEAAEIPEIRAAFDQFFETVETKETDQGVALFSKSEEGVRGGMTVESATNSLSQIIGKKATERLLGSGRFRIVRNQEEISGVGPRAETKGRVKGYYDPESRTSYVVAGNVTPDTLYGVFLHEFGAHYGLLRMIGRTEYGKVKKQLQNLHRLGNKRVIAARDRVPENTPEQYIWDETLAYLVENPANHRMSLVQRIFAKIRAFLKELGFLKTESLTVADMVELVKGAARHAARTAPRKPSVATGRSALGMAGINTRDENFRRWFGDSKVVDENGEPLVVFHGGASAQTPGRQGIDVFDPAKLGSYTRAASAEKGFFFAASPAVSESYSARQVDSTVLGGPALRVRLAENELAAWEDQTNYAEPYYDEEENGWMFRVIDHDPQFGDEYTYTSDYVYETEDEARDAAQEFQDQEIEKASKAVDHALEGEQESQKEETKRSGATIYPVYLTIKDPLIHDFEGGNYADQSFSELIEDAQEEGHDGVLLKNVRDAHPLGEKTEEITDVWVAFDPEQIKSAIGNRGTFDPADPNILHSTPADIWYSQMQNVLTERLPNKGPAAMLKQQVQNLAKKGQFKQDELEWSGLIEWLDSRGRDSTSKSEVVDFLRSNRIRVEEVTKEVLANMDTMDLAEDRLSRHGEIDVNNGAFTVTTEFSKAYGPDDEEGWTSVVINNTTGDKDYGDISNTRQSAEIDAVEAAASLIDEYEVTSTGGTTKFSEWQLPGGENYRELLLTLPHKPSSEEEARTVVGKEVWSSMTTEQRQEFMSYPRESDKRNQFRGGHYSEPNVLAHVRFNERTDADGARVLFIEEIQDDWTKEARRAAVQKAKSEGLKEHSDAFNERVNALMKDYSSVGVPNRPFKGQSAYMLAAKRMIRYAAENGFDSVAWTTAAQQISRYQEALRQNVDRIVWGHRKGEGKVVDIEGPTPLRLNVHPESGEVMDARPVGGNRSDVAEAVGKSIDHIVGKDIGRQILENKTGDLSGEGLTVGGKGFQDIYDKMLPSALNRYVKKWGAKVGTTEIESIPRADVMNGVFQEEIDEEVAEHGAPKANVHALPITESMRESVMEQGQPLFSLRSAIASKLTRRGTAQSYVRQFRDLVMAGEVTLRQLETSGLLDYLAGFDGTMLTRGEISQFMASQGLMSRDRVSSVGIDTNKILEFDETDRLMRGELPKEAVVYRLSRSGDDIPTRHIMPLTETEETREGAQAFVSLREALGADAQHMTKGEADRVLMLKVKGPYLVPRDEEGWMILSPNNVTEVRRTRLNEITADEEGWVNAEDVWETADPIQPEWQDTLESFDQTGPETRGLMSVDEGKKSKRVTRDKLREMGMDFENLPGDEVGSETWATEPVDQEPEEVDVETARRQLRQRKFIGMMSLDEDREGFHDFDVPTETRFHHLKRRLQDKFGRVQVIQQAIERSGGVLADANNVYQKELNMYGKTESDLTKLEEDYVEPLVEAMAKHNVSIEELDEYLEARHAPERNAWIQEINPKFREEGGGSGMTDEQAADAMDKFRQAKKLPRLERAAAYVDEMNKRRLEVWEEAGLEPQEYIDDLRERYEHYVPLKGFLDEREEVQTVERRGKGMDIRGRESKRALGRKSRAASPVLNTILGLEATHIRARKAEVGRALKALIEEFPNETLWRVVEAPDKEWQKPRFDERLGEVVYGPDPFKKLADDVLGVKEHGKQYYLHLKDPLLARALKNLGEERATGLVSALARMNRFLAMINTSLSPEFVLSNAARDIQTALINLVDEQDKGLIGEPKQMARKVLKSVPGAMRGAYTEMRNRGKSNDFWPRMFREYREAGGKIGFFGLRTIDTKRKKLLGMLKEAEGGFEGNSRKIFRQLGNFVMDANAAVENAARLAAYAHARGYDPKTGKRGPGLSRDKAANLARNLTVNFNKKGELGTVSNAMYLFYNAGLQGSARLIQAAVRSRKVQGVLAGIAVGAFALAELNRSIAGDDDDGENFYDKIADWEKQRNLIVMKPDGTYYKFPLPYGYNVPFVLGETINTMIHGRDKTQAVAHIVDTFLESFNPLGTEDSEQLGNRLLKMVSPTIIDPALSLGLNENFYGAPIAPENFPFGAQKPDSELYFSTVSPMAKDAASMMNRLTGGNPMRSGWIDVSPESIEHIANFMFGSAGRFARQSVEFPALVMSPEPLKYRQMPFVRRFRGEQSEWTTNSKYWEHKEEVDALYYEREYFNKNNLDVKGFDREYGHVLNLRPVFKRAEKELRRLRKRRRDIEADPSLDDRIRATMLRNINQKIESRQKSVNRQYNEAIDAQ